MHQGVTARAVVYNSADQLLLMERRKPGRHYFTLSGGHVEPGETAEQAVVREVLEETGVQVEVAKLLYTSIDIYHQDQRIFLCRYVSGEPALPPSSPEYSIDQQDNQLHQPGWFTPEALADQQVFPLGLLKFLTEDKMLNYQHNPRLIVERRV
jgi:mutator protein MutT